MKIFVHNKEIFITFFINLLNKTDMDKFRFAIQTALEKLEHGTFHGTGLGDIQVINLLGYHSTFIKHVRVTQNNSVTLLTCIYMPL